MRIKSINFIALLAITATFLFGFAVKDYGQEKKNEILMEVIIQSLNSGHYSTNPLNDEFSEKTYDLYLERMDYSKRFLLAQDVDLLNKYRTKIDNEIQNKSYDFFKLSNNILEGRINESRKFYKNILSKPFDFSVKETVETDPEKLDFAASKDELKERWRKILKRATLARVVNMLETQETALADNDETVEIKSFEEIEKEAREKVLKSHDDWFRRLDQLDENDRLSTYINAIANIFDPHTGYFPPKDKENFDISMSGQLEGIGATLSEKDGFTEVVRIVPGSPSARQGDLESGDLIMKVGQANDEPVDIEGMRLDDVVKMIRGKKGTEVRLTVKKISGDIITVPIVRDVVILDETYAKSALLNREDVKDPIGYIKLPKFYADFQQRGGRRCAVDVREEVEKLKAENVGGIILDLRNNGGGSLYDVVEMAGLFIDKGPVVQVKSRGANPEVMKDRDPSVVYDGPLIIMVNSFSASASEIMAAAMQDYDRAVIVGSPSTFGKGTVQRFYDLDRLISADYDDVKPLGALKLTTQKFYRINGGATQLKGVIPDIILPDAYSYIEVGEKEHDFSMPWDEIEPASYDKWDAGYSMEKVRQRSEKRTESDEYFQLAEDNANRLKRQRDKSEFTLNLEEFRAEKKANKEESEKYKGIEHEIDGLSVAALSMEPAITDTVKLEIQADFHKKLGKDIYLNEAISIMQDMK